MNIRILAQPSRNKLGIKVASILAFLLSWLLMQTAYTSPILIWNDPTTQDQLRGARNVEVMDVLFNVQFIDNSCNAIWTGCDRTLFRFPTRDLATAASHALLDQVLLDNPPLVTLDSNPWKLWGIEANDFAHVLTPFDIDPNEFFSLRTMAAVNRNAGHGDYVTEIGMEPHWGTGVVDNVVWAKWTVPEPTTVTLLGLGLAGLGLFRCKHKSIA